MRMQIPVPYSRIETQKNQVEIVAFGRSTDRRFTGVPTSGIRASMSKPVRIIPNSIRKSKFVINRPRIRGKLRNLNGIRDLVGEGTGDLTRNVVVGNAHVGSDAALRRIISRSLRRVSHLPVANMQFSPDGLGCGENCVCSYVNALADVLFVARHPVAVIRAGAGAGARAV